jgi:hypothetical protein
VANSLQPTFTNGGRRLCKALTLFLCSSEAGVKRFIAPIFEFATSVNFFLTRSDETTAAERFFGQKPRSMFATILDAVELAPAPRLKAASPHDVTVPE